MPRDDAIDTVLKTIPPPSQAETEEARGDARPVRLLVGYGIATLIPVTYRGVARGYEDQPAARGCQPRRDSRHIPDNPDNAPDGRASSHGAEHPKKDRLDRSL